MQYLCYNILMIDLLHDDLGFDKKGGDREALALIGAHTADFVAARDIGSIVFLDTGARNAHIPVSAAMKQLHPDHSVDYYFLNPTGLVAKEDYDVLDRDHHVFNMIAEGIDSVDSDMDKFMGQVGLDLCLAATTYQDVKQGVKNFGVPQHRSDIQQALVDNFDRVRKIARNPDNTRTLIFDQCMHRGLQLRAAKESLESAFPDRTFYTGVVDYIDEFTDFKPDLAVFHPDDFEPLGCTYFGRSGDASQLGKLDSKVDGLRSDKTYLALRRRQLVRTCKQLDFS
jgi:hypothetical protein